MKFKLLILAGLIFASVAAWLIYSELSKPEIVPLTKSWEKVIPQQSVPAGIVSLKSEDCATCHKEYYEEWQYSTHSHAWTDLQFQAELQKESSPFLCINCHIPLQNQQEWIVTGLEDGDIYRPVREKNPQFEPKLQMEGINCSSCHVRDGHIVGTGVSENAPHPVKVDRKMLSEELCIGCHNANAVVTPTLACTFETGDEWKAGPYYPEKNCISCHMEEVERPLVEGFPVRKGHAHFFAGSGIPKRKGAKTKGLDGMAFYPKEIAKNYKKGDELSFDLMLKNEFAGHRLPSGDPERFYLINLELRDENGKVIAHDSSRIGEQWQWYPVAKKLSDNNMNPKEERTYSLNYSLEKAGQLTLTAKVTKHRMDPETAEYNGLGEEYPLYITVFSKEYDLIVN